VIIRCQHVRTHALFKTLNAPDHPDLHEIYDYIDGEMFGWMPFRIPRIESLKGVTDQQYKEWLMHERIRLASESYQMIYKAFPEIKREGQCMAMHGFLLIPHGRSSYKEEMREIT